MSEEEVVEKIKTYLDIENDGFSGHLEPKTVQGLLDLYNKQKEEIQQKDIMIEAFKNALGNIIQGEKCCEEIKGGTTIRINLVKEKEKRIENALLYLKTMEETEDTYELEKILKGE